MDMNLRGPIGKLQKSSSRFYIQLSERFESNVLIHDTWAAMAHDMEHQATSLKVLRPSFWKLLKKEEKAISQAAKESRVLIERQVSDHLSDWSLLVSFHHALKVEEPIIIDVYAPIIYRLRTHWTERALDFYVMVNAHATRLMRLIQAFSGDPSLTQRCSELLLRFEKESQGPAPEPVSRKKKLRGARRAPNRVRATSSRLRRPRQTPRPLSKRVKRIAKPSKRLVKTIGMHRSRAGR